MKLMRVACLSTGLIIATTSCGIFDGGKELKVSGSLSGLEEGKSLTVSLNESNELALKKNGNFTFDVAMADAQSYEVVVLTQPEEQSCIVNNGVGSISDASVGNVQVVCLKEGEYTLSAEVVGLDGSMRLKMASAPPGDVALDGQNATELEAGTITTDDVSADQVEVSDGASVISDELNIEISGTYTFTTPVPTGNGYAVKIDTSPSDQICRTEASVGVVESENVTVKVVCAPKDDEDGDGLTNEEEINTYHTSPKIADTDGDGLSDYEEIVTRGYSEAKPYLFNPRIADLPKLKIEIASQPNVILKTAEGKEVESSSAATTTTGDISSHTLSKSESWDAGIEIEVKATGKVSVGTDTSSEVGYEYRQMGHFSRQESWLNESTSEEYDLLESTTGSRDLNSTEISGGAIQANIKLLNQSNRAFTVTNVILNSNMTNERGEFKPVGSLLLDGVGTYPESSLAPGNATGELTFSNTNLFTNTAKELFVAKSIDLYVAAYDVVDQDGVSMAFLEEQANAQGARIAIDYANYAPPESYVVATNYNPDVSEVPLSDILSSVLQKDYEEDASGILSIDSVSRTQHSKWMVLHNSFDGVSRSVTLYNPEEAAFSVVDIKVSSGDTVTLMYLSDEDDDGLGIRQELALGTSPNKADTDGDGRSDYEEVYEQWVVTAISSEFPDRYPSEVYSDPTIADIDGDGDNDLTEMNKGNDPYNSDTDGDTTPDSTDTDVVTASFAILADKAELLSATKAKLSGLVIPDSGDGVCSIVVDWGDATANSTKTIACASITTGQSFSFEHNYVADSGSHTATITATDSKSAVVSKSYTFTSTEKFITDRYTFNRGWREAVHFREVVDIDNDGKADIVSIDSSSGVWVSKGTATGFSAPVLWSSAWTLNSSSDHSSVPRHLVDVDGDGDLDLVGFYPAFVYVDINDGTKFQGPTNWFDGYGRDSGWDSNLHIRTFGDVDGNGYVDIIGFGPDKIYVTLNNGAKDANGNMLKITETSQLKSTDFSEHEPSDLFYPGIFTQSTGWNRWKHPRWIVDINRDGKDDILSIGSSSIIVALADGTGLFGEPHEFLKEDASNISDLQGGWSGDRKFPRMLADVDGDGDQDIVGFGDTAVVLIENTSIVGGAVSFASKINVSNEFVHADGWRYTFDESSGWRNNKKHIRSLADMNGDGKLDIVGFGGDGPWVALNKGDMQFAQALKWQDTEFDLGGSASCTYEWHHDDGSVNNRYFFTRRAVDVNGDGSADMVGFGRCATKAVFSSTIQ